MFIKLRNRRDSFKQPSWKAYQSRLRKGELRKRRARVIIRFIPIAVGLFFCGYIVLPWLWGIRTPDNARHDVGMAPSESTASKISSVGDDPGGVRNDIRKVFQGKSLANLRRSSFNIDCEGKTLRVDTTLDIPLQEYLIENMDPSTSRFIAIVVLDPLTGRVLAMTGLNKLDPSGNPCINTMFPAASLFKIITASAAIETCGLTSKSTLTYNGKKHTLYKSQIKDIKNRYSNRVTFQTSFAESINPVFGKIGAIDLGKSVLNRYAESFGFNRDIDFELELSPSSVFLDEDPYQWAEVASGFNNDTTISPLHGALMVSPVLNQGRWIAPSIVDQVVDEHQQCLYRSQPVPVYQAIRPETSRVVKELMEATVRYGTSRKTFRGYSRDRILSRLSIGGKTGSIDNKTHDVRYDWFVGFAEEKQGDRNIVVSVLVGHEKYIGKRAGYYAKIAMKKYFQDYFANQLADKGQGA